MLLRFRLQLQNKRLRVAAAGHPEDVAPGARFINARTDRNNESLQRVHAREYRAALVAKLQAQGPGEMLPIDSPCPLPDALLDAMAWTVAQSTGAEAN
jgi:hypothetical protein